MILDKLDDAVARNNDKAEKDPDFRHYYHAAMNRAHRLGEMNHLLSKSLNELEKYDAVIAQQFRHEFLRQSA